MAERVLSTRELNRALLARQLLLERSRLPIARAVERIAGLQTQYAPSAYVSLWSRLHGFPREALTKALEARRVVQSTLMRATIHIVSAGDYPLFAAGIRRERRKWWLGVTRRQVEGLDMEAVARFLRKELRGGPRRQDELVAALDREGFPRIAWNAAPMWLEMVRVPPSGTWVRRRADLFGLADAWLGRSAASEADGLEHLVRRYLGGFGPASLNDVASWSGVPVTTIRPVVERLATRRFGDERGGVLFDLPRAPLPDADTLAPVRFLPTWEATLLVHARRTQILPEAYRPRIFSTKTPHSMSTFLVDGSVAGAWRYERDRVVLDPFERLTRATRAELDDEADRLAAFHRDG